MATPVSRILGLMLSVLVLAPAAAGAAGVQVVFDFTTPATGPFPSDRFTTPDESHLTGLRVDLPSPDCGVRPSDCADIAVLNTLDGFNLQPRLSIPFTGAIDVATVSGSTVFLVSLGDAATGAGAGKVVGINQVVWDPVATTLHTESDQLLDQHTRYVLVVTSGVRDAAGDPVEPGDFARFRHDENFGQTHDAALKAHRKAVLSALRAPGVPRDGVVAATVFTTQSATAVLEKIRAQIKAATPAPADFLIATNPAGTTRARFARASVTGVVFNRQVSTVSGPVSSPLPIQALAVPGVGTVGALAFGRITSPDYETAARIIPPVGTRTGEPAMQATNDLHFTLFLPDGTPPAAGWPVAIFGHGFGDSKQGAPVVVAASMAGQGIATIAINVVGHGGGPLGTLTVNTVAGPFAVPAGGRGIDQNGNGTIDSTEGVNAAPPAGIIGSRDGLRQTVVDLMQLVRVIETGGVDADGDGFPDLDPSRIYYFGQSFGGIYGTMFLAVEPSVRVGVPNVPGGPTVDITVLSPVFRGLLAAALGNRIPSLLNGGGPGSFGFTDNLPLRDQPPVTSPAPGAMAIQAVIDNTEWVSQAGNPVAYAPHLRAAPLDGVPAKAVIVQFARGDQTVPNPTATAILRAGDLAAQATYFRADLEVAAAVAATAGQPPAVAAALVNPLKNPHTFLTNIGHPYGRPFALAAQAQIATFFASDGALVIDPDPIGPFDPGPTFVSPVGIVDPPPFPAVSAFEVPIVPPLPETLNFIP